MGDPVVTEDDVARLERCMEEGGIACIPTDTVYGLASDPASPSGPSRLTSAKARDPRKPSAIMFGTLDLAEAATPWLPAATTAAIHSLLPGPVTLLVPNPLLRFRYACGSTPHVLGIRVPDWPAQCAALAGLKWPVMQTSANMAGGAPPASLDELDPAIESACDLVLDGGTLPGEASTVIDLTEYAINGTWTIVREGAFGRTDVERRLAAS